MCKGSNLSRFQNIAIISGGQDAWRREPGPDKRQPALKGCYPGLRRSLHEFLLQWPRKTVRTNRESLASSSKKLFYCCRRSTTRCCQRAGPLIALRQKSKTMRTAVEKADAVVQVRSGCCCLLLQYLWSSGPREVLRRPRASGQVERLELGVAWCKVTVLRLEDCERGRRTDAGRGTVPEHHGHVDRPWLQWPGSNSAR